MVIIRFGYVLLGALNVEIIQIHGVVFLRDSASYSAIIACVSKTVECCQFNQSINQFICQLITFTK